MISTPRFPLKCCRGSKGEAASRHQRPAVGDDQFPAYRPGKRRAARRGQRCFCKHRIVVVNRHQGAHWKNQRRCAGTSCRGIAKRISGTAFARRPRRNADFASPASQRSFRPHACRPGYGGTHAAYHRRQRSGEIYDTCDAHMTGAQVLAGVAEARSLPANGAGFGSKHTSIQVSIV